MRGCAYLTAVITITLFTAACGQSASPARSSAPPLGQSASAQDQSRAPVAASPSEQAKVAFSGGDPNGYQIRISQAGGAVSGLPFYAALDRGFFKQEHLAASLVNLSSGVVAISALTNGETQFNNTPVDTIQGAVRGLPLKVVFEAWEKSPWTVMGKPELTSLQSLTGRVVAASTPGSVPNAFFDAALKKAGMSMNDIQLRSISGTSTIYSQLVGGGVDAAVMSPPFDAMAVQKGFREVAFIGDVLDLPYLGLGADAGFIRDHRPQVVATLRAVLQANRWLKANPDAATELVVKYFGSPPDVAKLSVDKMLPLLSETGRASPQGIKEAIDIQAQIGQAQVRLTPDQVVDYGPLEEALASLH